MQYQTPFHLYEESRIRHNSQNLTEAMKEAGFSNFRNYFAVKALPNPAILRILADEGQGFDCSSIPELLLAEMAGARGSDIIFTSNNTTSDEFAAAAERGAIINFDDISLVHAYLANSQAPEVACCRYTPDSINIDDSLLSIIGTPEDSKYGMTRTDLIESYRLLKESGAKRFGLHCMVLSNSLNWRHHATVAKMMFELASGISEEIGIDFEFINLGGGIGVAYRPNDDAFDYASYAKSTYQAYQNSGLVSRGAPQVLMECGRAMTASAGWLVTKVQTIKKTQRTFVGVDASMADLMRPGMYDAYHYVTVLNKNDTHAHEVVDVVGALCENNDKFAVQRDIPITKAGDIIVIHTTGAHGHSMGFNYNGRLRHGEVLVRQNGDIDLIRRAETIEDLFATLQSGGVSR